MARYFTSGGRVGALQGLPTTLQQPRAPISLPSIRYCRSRDSNHICPRHLSPAGLQSPQPHCRREKGPRLKDPFLLIQGLAASMPKQEPVYEPVDDLIICYDGTWCGEATGTTGNMKILADIFACKNKPPDWKGLSSDHAYEEMLQLGPGRKVCVRYFEGPGINGSLEQYLMNGALALDIKKHIVDAYQLIVQRYRKGTRVWLFGLSRGAYLVRSVAGIINNLGILNISKEKQATEVLEEAARVAYLKELRLRLDGLYDVYRSPDPLYAPHEKWSEDFRAAHSWDVDADKEGGPIYLMGLLDTVGALGLPQVNAGGHLGYELYDQNVSSEVQRVYQALALTDRLAPFEPCFIRRSHTNAHLPTEEVWFPGAHYDIGRQKFLLLRRFAGGSDGAGKGLMARVVGGVGRGVEAMARYMLSLHFEVDYTPALSNPPLCYLLRRVQEADSVVKAPPLLPDGLLSDPLRYIARFAKDDPPNGVTPAHHYTIDAYDEIVEGLQSRWLGRLVSGFVNSQVLADRRIPLYDTPRLFYGGPTLEARPDNGQPYRSKTLDRFRLLKLQDGQALPSKWLYTQDLPTTPNQGSAQ